MICREIAYQSYEKTLIDNFVDNSKNKHLSEFKFMVVMYQFGERLLVYNVNVCILQMINECICKIFKMHVMRFIGAMI